MNRPENSGAKEFKALAPKLYSKTDFKVEIKPGKDPVLIYKTLAGKEVERVPAAGKSAAELKADLLQHGIRPIKGEL